MSTSHLFYRNLVSFDDFVSGAFDPTKYSPLPEDWSVVIADAIDSTQAVARGQYVEVNYLGAACIAAVTHAVGDDLVAAVFAGDGATFAVPPQAKDATLRALLETRRWALDALGLELRIGLVGANQLARSGARLEVAKFELSPGTTLAMLRGEGIDTVEALVKADGSLYRVHDEEPIREEPVLDALSCRWAPMASTNGKILCLIVAAEHSADEVYRQVLRALDSRLDLSSHRVNPVKTGALRFGAGLGSLRREIRSTRGSLPSRIGRALLMRLAGHGAFTLGLPLPRFDAQEARQAFVSQTDFRRVNGTLRLVLDCTSDQVQSIHAYLEVQQTEGKLVYGAHSASQAIVTCLAPDYSNREHVHYVDGGDGGLWVAAQDLKQKLNARANTPPTGRVDLTSIRPVIACSLNHSCCDEVCVNAPSGARAQ